MKLLLGPFAFMGWRTGFWFHLWGYGLAMKLSRFHRPLFSERYGYRKVWRHCGIAVEVLKPREAA